MRRVRPTFLRSTRPELAPRPAARRRRMSGVLLALLLLAVPGAAFAQAYPPAASELSISASVAAPGALVTVSGDGFMPGAAITITFESTPVLIGVAVADASGRFTADVHVPADATPGVHTIRAAGLGADGQMRVLSSLITVAGVAGEGTPAFSPPAAAGPGGAAGPAGAAALAPAPAPRVDGAFSPPSAAGAGSARPAPARRGAVALTGANIALIAGAALVVLGGGLGFLAVAGRRSAPDESPEG